MNYRFLKQLLLILVLIAWVLPVAAQQKRLKHQVYIITENDSYAGTGSDRYYTNGTFVGYAQTIRKPLFKDRKLESVRYALLLGHEMYTPYTATIPPGAAYLIDRPFAAYVFAKADIAFFYLTEKSLSLGFTVGLTGPQLHTQKLHTWVHKAFGMYQPYGWEYQIDNHTIFNVHAGYDFKILQFASKKNNRLVDLFGLTAANIGTGFNHASAGLLLRVGKLDKMNYSASFNNQSNLDPAILPNLTAYFFYLKPALRYVAYNIIIEGKGLPANLLETRREATHWVVNIEAGFTYSLQRWSANLAYTYRSSETKLQHLLAIYGSLNLFYRF